MLMLPTCMCCRWLAFVGDNKLPPEGKLKEMIRKVTAATIGPCRTGAQGVHDPSATLALHGLDSSIFCHIRRSRA
jgi:hypothetical protein